jgi:two-component system, NtrC family, sensor kinase
MVRFWNRSPAPFRPPVVPDDTISIQELYAQSQRQAQREQLINHITSQTRQSLKLEIILSEAIAQLLDALNLDRCLVHLVRQSSRSELILDAPPQLCTANGHIAQRRQTLFEVHRDAYESSIDRFDTDGPITQWVIQHRQPVMIVDTAADLRIGYQNLEYQQNQVRSSLVVPVLSGRRLYAILYLNQCEHTRTWTKDDQKLAQAVADQLAISIQQAILYTQAQQQALDAAQKSRQLENIILELQQTQAQLLQSEKMSSLGRVVAGFAHEINNPVGFIYGNLPYLENYLMDLSRLVETIEQSPMGQSPEVVQLLAEMDFEFVREDMPRILRSMRSGAERIRQVVLSLRNFSRLDESVRKPADVHIGIENTLLMLQSQLRDRGITIRREYADLPMVDCYPGHLNQVFMNLLLNAIEALEGSQQKNPLIIISTNLIQDDRSKGVQVRISDNGPGITEADQRKIFDPFFTTKRIGEGMGLGLSVCYQTVINQHRGKLRLESKSGQGCTFTLELPTQFAGDLPREVAPAIAQSISQSISQSLNQSAAASQMSPSGLGMNGVLVNLY